MEEKFRKTNSYSNDIPSPVLLRRRLSAPETIMRKHMLAQQRSDSQDSDGTQISETKSCQWRNEIAAGSDPNLNRKRDSSLMRKSTLLRRLWSTNTKPFTSTRFSGSFYEWQHSFGGKLSSGKSTHSLTSNHSSPEHLNKSQSRRSLNSNEFKTSPQHKSPGSRKISPKHQVYEPSNEQNMNNINTSPKRKVSVLFGNFDNSSRHSTISNSENTIITSSSDNRISSTVTPKTTTTETESENYSTRSTNTSYTTFSDNSDSAYTYTKSNFTQSSNNNSIKSSEITKQITEEGDNQNQQANQTRFKMDNYQQLDSNSNDTPKSNDDTRFIKYSNSSLNEISTQTQDTTNLNVISNVQLSQSTLDLIFNQVMQDVHKTLPNNDDSQDKECNVQEAKVINVQQVPSFYLKRKEDITTNNPEHSRIVKYMISNIGTGSPYSKPAEVPQVVVPRYSALPRTSSMEVNTSSGESEDKESDTISLVDSLEDPHSPRLDPNFNNHDDKPVRGNSDLSPLLPDNSDNKKKNKQPSKKQPASFFIPIELDSQKEVKPVSDHLPSKVREKLAKRQQKREEKMMNIKSKQSSPRSDSNYISASDNGNHVNLIMDNNSDYNLNCNLNLPKVNYIKAKKKNKPILPSIETIRKIKIDRYEEKQNKEPKMKIIKRKTISKENSESSSQSSRNHKQSTNWSSKSKNHKSTEKLSPIYTTRNEYVYDSGPRRIYHKTEFNNANKRIEILEIMECIDPSSLDKNQSKGKSKIPVLVHQKLPKISAPPHKMEKPTFLDFEEVQITDPKLDQLIANILIDTLNNSGIETVSTPTNERSGLLQNNNDGNRRSPQSPVKHSPVSKYQQKFEVIPEELSFQSSTDDAQKDRRNNNSEEGLDMAAKMLVRQTLSNNNEKCTKADDSSYKGKAAVAVVRDENFSTIPKGWITFYMLHKNNGSPDSTSDEGKNLNNTNIKESDCQNEDNNKTESNNNNNNNNHNVQTGKNSENIELPTKQSNATTYKIVKKDKNSEQGESFSSSSEEIQKIFPPQSSTGRHKKHSNYSRKQRTKNMKSDSQQFQEEWSVTVSGTNSYGQFAPDLEMRLKFPSSTKNNTNNPSQSDSGLGEDNVQERRSCFPKIDNRKFVNSSATRQRYFESGELDSYRQHLPQIDKGTKFTRKIKRSDSSIPIGSMVPSRIQPRPTRTSTRRYHLTRPKFQHTETDNSHNTLSIFEESHYAEILRRFPEILAITGRSISPERKPKVSTMSDRDLTRNFYTSPH